MALPSNGGGGGTSVPTPPSSSGSGDGKTVSHSVHLPWWPQGDPGRLRAAAGAWRAAAQALTAAGEQGSAAVAAVQAENQGAVFDAVGARWRRVYYAQECLAAPSAGAPMLDNLVAGCQLLAQACDDYADHIESARRRLEELAAELVAGLVVGGLLTFVTAGLSDAAAAANAARIAAEALDLAVTLERILSVAFRIGGFAIQGAIVSSGSDVVMQAVRKEFNPNTTFSFGEAERALVFGAATGPAFGYAGQAAGRGIARVLGAKDLTDVPREFPWTGSGPDPAARRVTLRVATKQAIIARYQLSADGRFYIDPETMQRIPVGAAQFGHAPGNEWWRTQNLARQQQWTRRQVIAYENDPTHYRLEVGARNMGHADELPAGANASQAASEIAAITRWAAGAGQVGSDVGNDVGNEVGASR